MKKLLIILSVVLAAAVLALTLIVTPDTAPAVAGTPSQLHVELIVAGGPKGPAPLVGPIPPNGSGWHELYPTFCSTYTQDGYEDNGDGVVSACDLISLSGVQYHIVWAGPTYWTTCSPTPGGPGSTVIFEPTQPTSGGNPICEVWHEIYPNFCNQIHIDSWIDNGDGLLSVCDVVDVESGFPTGPNSLVATYYHIDRIECDITIEPVTVPVAPSTWGKIKSYLGGRF